MLVRKNFIKRSVEKFKFGEGSKGDKSPGVSDNEEETIAIESLDALGRDKKRVQLVLWMLDYAVYNKGRKNRGMCNDREGLLPRKPDRC